MKGFVRPERLLYSSEAESVIKAGGKKDPHDIKSTVDQAAAVLILETYMLRHGKN